MIGGVNGFNANVNFDFNGAHSQNLKAREEKEAANLMSNLTAQINYDTVNPSELDYDQLKIWADNVDPEQLSGKKLSMWLGAKMGFEKVMDDWRKELGLKPDEPVFARRIFSLSGYTRDDKISIITIKIIKLAVFFRCNIDIPSFCLVLVRTLNYLIRAIILTPIPRNKIKLFFLLPFPWFCLFSASDKTILPLAIYPASL